MLVTTVSVNKYCQAQTIGTFALENIKLLYLRFYIYNCNKFIMLTFFHCERTATQNIIFTVVFKID